MGWLSKVVGEDHRRHKKEDAKKEAALAAQQAQAAAQAAKATLEKQKKEFTQNIQSSAKDAQQKANTWKSEQLQNIENNYNLKSQELVDTKEQVNREKLSSLHEIESSHIKAVEKIDLLRINSLSQKKTQYDELISDCQQQIINIKSNRTAAVKELSSSLEHKVKDDFFNIEKAYSNITSSTKNKQNQVGYYSKLAAWLKLLKEENKISADEYEKKLSFLQTVSFSDVDMTSEVKEMHESLLSLLKLIKEKQIEDLYKHGANDKKLISRDYKKDNTEIEKLKTWLEQETEQVEEEYLQETNRLEKLKSKKINALEEHLDQALTTLQQEQVDLKCEYDKNNQEVSSHHDHWLQSIDSERQRLLSDVEKEQLSQLQQIDNNLSQELSVIRNNLEQKLKQIKHKSRGLITNAITAVASACGAYFAPTLLAGAASEAVIASVQASLAATSAAAISNLANKKYSSAGLKVHFSFTPNTFSPQSQQNEPIESQYHDNFDLEKFKLEFLEKSRRILGYSSEIETKLRSKLTKPVNDFFNPNLPLQTEGKLVKKTNLSESFGIQQSTEPQRNNEFQLLLNDAQGFKTSITLPATFMQTSQKYFSKRNALNVLISTIKINMTFRPEVHNSLHSKTSYPHKLLSVKPFQKTLFSLIEDYRQDGESWLGASGRFLRESGLRDALDQGFEVLGEWTDTTIKSIAGFPERAARGIAKNLNFDIRSGAPCTEQGIDAAKLAISQKINSDAKGIVPALTKIAQEYDVTADELLALRTYAELFPLARIGKVAAQNATATVSKQLTRLDSALPPPPILLSGFNSASLNILEKGVKRHKAKLTPQSINAKAALEKKLKVLQKAQNKAKSTEVLLDGRIRYYMPERSSSTHGPTRGASFVIEHNPATGQVRSWNECYDHKGNVNRIHPKNINGQDVNSQHYPPTKSELDSFFALKSRGPKQ